ncbi:hypothetical protein GCM10027614_39360 [Micromonospora vulcania]
MLVANVNRGVSVDRLVDAVWEADPPATAREQVQNCVSMLRRSLDNGANDATINRSGRGYQLDADPYEIDAHCFERDLHSAAEHLDENRPEAAAAVLHGALALWTGPALDGLDAVELRAHALRLDELRATATERLIQTKIRLGRLDDAVADLRRLTGLHPTDERYMLLLVDALLLGRRPQRHWPATVLSPDAWRTISAANRGPAPMPWSGGSSWRCKEPSRQPVRLLRTHEPTATCRRSRACEEASPSRRGRTRATTPPR